MYPKGGDFIAVNDLKTYFDTLDPFYVYSVDENRQIVFKTSRVQLKIAADACIQTSKLSEEYCCFDGKVNRVKSFVTLTSSIYHPFLQEQVPLAYIGGF